MDETILICFLMHRCSPSEIKQVEQWVTADQTNANWLFEMERIWSLKDEWRFSDQQKVETAYKQFLNKNKTEIPPKRYSLRNLMKYAAIIIGIILVATNLYQYYQLTAEVPLSEIEVPKGQRISLTLSDGTKVWLNSESTLKYPAKFSSKSRNVTLVGEGFFEVNHDAKTPFIVHSSEIKINVLGTKFNVKAYPSETFYVTLTEGKVEVSTNDESDKLILKPSQQVKYTPKTGLRLAGQVDDRLVKSWTIGELSFVNSSLGQIAVDLERRFNVQISIQDQELASDVFTCRFKENVTIEQVMKYLKETQRMDYRVNGRQIDIIKYK